MGRITKSLLTTVLFLSFTTAHAGLIDQSQRNAGIYLGGGDIGQSFTAIDSAIESISVNVADWNQHLGQPFELTLSLFAGTGWGDPALESVTEILPLDFGLNPSSFGGEWFTFDMNDVLTTIGDVYSFRVHSTNSDGGIFYQSSGDVYAGGTMLNSSGAVNNSDLAFRVQGASAVSEPGSIVLLGLGTIALGLSRRRKSQK